MYPELEGEAGPPEQPLAKDHLPYSSKTGGTNLGFDLSVCYIRDFLVRMCSGFPLSLQQIKEQADGINHITKGLKLGLCEPMKEMSQLALSITKPVIFSSCSVGLQWSLLLRLHFLLSQLPGVNHNPKELNRNFQK